MNLRGLSVECGRVKRSANSDGWVTVSSPDAGLHVRFGERDGRLVVTDLYLHGEQITPALLRGVSISRLEAWVNTRSDPVAHHAAASARTEWSGARPEPTLEKLRGRYLKNMAPPDQPESSRRRLARPSTMAAEEFYPLVAEAYAEYAQETRAPAKEIAAEAEVPVTTAHRWIREARRRGFLPPARKGKAG